MLPNAGAVRVLLMLAVAGGCHADGEDADELFARTEVLLQAADTTSDAADRVVLLERARTLLYRIMGAEEASDAAAALADGRTVGGLSLRRVEGALRTARMDVALTNPGYARLIENALVAAAAAHPSEQDRAYETIALAQARLGDIEGALATARNISDQARWRAGRFPSLSRSDPPVVLASLQARAGDLEGALRTPEELGVSADDVWAELAFARAVTGDVEGAGAMMSRLEASASRGGGSIDGILRLLDITRAWSAIGDAERAAEVLEQARRNAVAYVRPSDPLARIAAAWAALGRPERAGEVMLRALALAEQPQWLGSDGSLGNVAAGLVEIGEIEAARSIADFISGVGRSAGPRRSEVSEALEHRKVLEAIALALSDRGETRAALASLPPSQYEAPFLRMMAARRAEAGDIGGALAVVARLGIGDLEDIDPWDLDFEGVVVQVALAEARADGGDAETARDRLGAITRGLESDESPYRYILDGVTDYAQATLWQGIGSAWAALGDRAAARAAFEAAARTASGLGMTFPLPPGLARAERGERWPDTDLFGTFGSDEPFDQAMSDALGDDWWPAGADYVISQRSLPFLTYVRGFTLRQIACAANAAGLPIPVDTLREAAIAEADDYWADGSGRSAESWVVRAVAVALVERSCPD